MQFTNLRKLANQTVTWWIVFLISSLPLFVSCSDSQEPTGKKPQSPGQESFSFFDLSNRTQFSERVREDLSSKLGRDAIERRNILDLDINYKGFIKKYFPELDALNQKLNFPPRERVDHNTVKLMYRYAQKKNVPFEYVELVFSEYTGTPVLFKINFKVDESAIVDTLREKYGKPEVITWSEENGESMFWKKNGDFLIVSLVPNQFGKHDYQIVIYYTKNLEQLIETERKEKEAKAQQEAKKGKAAF